MGRGDVWDGDAGTSYTGKQGTQDVNDYCNESEVNAISLRENALLILWST